VRNPKPRPGVDFKDYPDPRAPDVKASYSHYPNQRAKPEAQLLPEEVVHVGDQINWQGRFQTLADPDGA